MNSFYTMEELQKIGFKSLGKDILLSKKTSIYNAQNISIGNNVRIDDFVILSGYITIKNHIHISAGSVLMAKEEGIYLDDFSAVSIHCKILGSSDDFRGDALVGPCVPIEYRKITSKPIRLEKFSLLGCGSTILPGGSLAEGVSIGASSLIIHPTQAWGVYFGIPAKRISERNKNILNLKEEFLASKNNIYNTMGGGDKQPLDYSVSFNAFYSTFLFSTSFSKVA